MLYTFYLKGCDSLLNLKQINLKMRLKFECGDKLSK